MLLHGLESGLVILHSLCKTRIEAQVVVGRFPFGSGGAFRGASSKYLCNLELSWRLFKFCLGFFYESHPGRNGGLGYLDFVGVEINKSSIPRKAGWLYAEM